MAGCGASHRPRHRRVPVPRAYGLDLNGYCAGKLVLGGMTAFPSGVM
jgi:hypothetical protein